MADDATTTTAPADDTPAETTPAPYAFPFVVPELAAATDDDLRALHAQVREHAATFAGLSPADTTGDTIAALRACRDLAVSIVGEINDRADRFDEASAMLADLAAADIADLTGEPDEPQLPDPDPAPAPTPPTPPAPAAPAAPAAVTAARRPNPRVRDVARGSGTPQLPQETQNQRYGSMTAASDGGGFHTGQSLERFEDAARILSTRIDQYPSATMQDPGTRGWGDRRPVTAYDPDEPSRQFELRNYTRHSGVQLRRQFPADLVVAEGSDDRRGYAIAQYAGSERRLPGGSLAESAKLAVKGGRSLTAAAGWCAPSDTMWDLLEMETEDGLLDTPTLQTTRGGWNIPINGGPDFSAIYNAIGNAGDTHLSEAQVIAGTNKISTEIPCPPFAETRLGVDYYSLTGGLLQRRGYPEVVARWSRAAVVALAHKINKGVIAGIVAGSGAATVIPSDPSGDDAPAALLAAIELAIVDAKYRNRMGFSATMEVVLPWWVLVPIRAALSRRKAEWDLAVTDAQILEWFTVRKAVPRFVYDWQDSFAGLAAGPGGPNPIWTLPLTAQFVVYPSGTWVKAVQDVVALDTIYDSTLLKTNQYTAVFVEDGWAMLKMSPMSRLYTVAVDPSGVTACCPSTGVS